MTEDSLIAAFGRLEQAVARFEARLPGRLEEGVPSPSVPAGVGAAADARYARLEERHEALRLRAAAAVERLDRLLEPERPETERPDQEQPEPTPPEPTQGE